MPLPCVGLFPRRWTRAIVPRIQIPQVYFFSLCASSSFLNFFSVHASYLLRTVCRHLRSPASAEPYPPFVVYRTQLSHDFGIFIDNVCSFTRIVLEVEKLLTILVIHQSESFVLDRNSGVFRLGGLPHFPGTNMVHQMPIVFPIECGVLKQMNKAAPLYLLLKLVRHRSTGNFQQSWHDVHLTCQN